MSDPRTAILNRLRQAQRTGRLPAPARNVVVPAPKPFTSDELLARFLGELAALGVEAHVETNDSCVRERIRAIMADVENPLAFAWDAAWLPYGVGDIMPNTVLGSSPRDDQARAGIGVTGSDGAIAETGSVVVLAGEGRPRAASLLPPVHLAIVKRNDLRFAMGEYFRERADAIASASSCMVVTGPSRTADIELTLTLGVHGPGKVIVVVGP